MTTLENRPNTALLVIDVQTGVLSPLRPQDTGNLTNGGTAANVQVQLLNGNLQPINITTNSNNQLETNGSAINAGVADLKYYARYYATGAATAGSVDTSVQFSMQYQ